MLQKCETPVAGGASRDSFPGTLCDPYVPVLWLEFGFPILDPCGEQS